MARTRRTIPLTLGVSLLPGCASEPRAERYRFDEPEPIVAVEPSVEDESVEPPAPPESGGEPEARTRKHTRRDDYRFVDADVLNVIDAIATTSGASIIVPPGLHGTVTIRLRDVPWLTALDLAVGQLGYEVIEDRGIYHVCPRRD